MKRRAKRQPVTTKSEMMLTISFREETGRTGFMDLTGEIRNMIYSYALFDPRPGGRVMCKSDVLYDAESDCLRTIVFGDCRTHSRNTELTARVNMLCAMSKQVCHEVRGVFWSGFRHLLNPYDSDMSSFEVTHRYLRKIGSEGKAGVTELPLVLGHRHLGYEGRTAFRGLGQLLHPCLNLQRFTLSIGVTHILWNDREQLQDYLLHGKPLVSPGFDEFVRILRSLQRLRQVTIKMIPSFQASYRLWQEEPDKFLQFACSGIREFSLYLFMYERLNANHTRLHKGTPRKFGDAIVWLDFPPYLDNDGGSEIQDFKGWLQWREKTARETRRYIEQMDPDTDDDG
jgi:hypothetical protein